jgi:co-chaperonin GroES (HSP10)
MLKLPRNRVACVPIFDSSDSGIKGYVDAKPDSGYKRSESGNIILLDEYRERVDQGIVKYVGAGVTRERYGFGIGDMVIFSGYSGELVSIEGEGLFIILPARFVVCSIETKPTVVSGLYFKSSYPVSASLDGEYFPATYEKAVELIAQALGETSVIKIAKDRPDLEDYKRVEEEDEE